MSLQWRNDVFIPSYESNASAAALCKSLAEPLSEVTGQYLVRVDGVTHSGHVYLFDAQKAAFSLAQYYPEADVNIVAVQARAFRSAA